MKKTLVASFSASGVTDSVPGAVIEEGMLQRGTQDLNAWETWAKGL